MKTQRRAETSSHPETGDAEYMDLTEVVKNALEIESAIARTLLQLRERFIQHHDASVVFAKMAGAAAEHETLLQRGWARTRMTPKAYLPIDPGVRSKQQELLRELQHSGANITNRSPTLNEAIHMCFRIIEGEEQAIDALITSMGHPNLFARALADSMPFYKNPEYKAALFALARTQGLMPCEWSDISGLFSYGVHVRRNGNGNGNGNGTHQQCMPPDELCDPIPAR